MGFVAVFYLFFITQKAKDSIKFDQVGVYKKFFHTYFDNFEFERFAKYEEVVDFVSIRPSDVPSDASISRMDLGAVGTINGMKYFSAWTVWNWTRVYVAGNVPMKQEFYYHVFSVKIIGIADRFASFDLQLRIPNKDFLNFRKPDLENEEFNKVAWIKSNDEIALRRLLTPHTQEQLAAVCAIDSRSTGVYLTQNSFVMTTPALSPLFSIEFDFSLNRDVLLNSIVTDFKNDLSSFIAMMSKITLFKTLKTG